MNKAQAFNALFSAPYKTTRKIRDMVRRITSPKSTPYSRVLTIHSMLANKLLTIDTNGVLHKLDGSVVTVPKFVLSEEEIVKSKDAVKALLTQGVCVEALEAVGFSRSILTNTGLIEAPKLPEIEKKIYIDSGKGSLQQGHHHAERLPDGTWYESKSLTAAKIKEAMLEIAFTPRYRMQEKYGCPIGHLISQAKRIKSHGVDINIPEPHGTRNYKREMMPDGTYYRYLKHSPRDILSMYADAYGKGHTYCWTTYSCAFSEVLRKTRDLLRAGMKLPEGAPIHPALLSVS